MADGESSYRRFLEGDKCGFEEVVDIYKDNLIYFINRFVHNLDVAEDIAADTFADLFVHKNRYNFKNRLKTYIFTIGRNKSVNYIKKNAKIVDLQIENKALTDEILIFEEEFLKEERKKQINAAVNKLNSDYKAVIHLLYFEDLSYEDAAKILRKNKKQIDNLAYRARNSLKSILIKEGFSYEI